MIKRLNIHILHGASAIAFVFCLSSGFCAVHATSLNDAPASDSGGTTSASGPPAADQNGGDIIVTAERRATSIQRTPVSVGVIGSDDLTRAGIKKLWDANGAVAGLYLNSYPSNMQYVSIRGIGTADPGVFSAVGYYLDDVYLGRTFGRGAIDLPDIERVEVLRGPQGTLYGQNTTGGALKFVSRAPSLTTSKDWVSISLGNLGAREAHAYLSAPIVTDTLSASLAYSHRQNDGDTYNAYRHVNVDRLFVDQFRGKLRWAPGDKLDITLSVDGTIDSSDNFIQSPNNAPGINRPRLVYANTDTQMHRNDLGETLKVEYKLNNHLSLKSISANRHDHTDPHPWDSDGLSTDAFGWNQNFLEKIKSQEIQFLGDYRRFNFTIGANYYDESFDFHRLQWLANNYTHLDAHPTYKSYAIYGQAKYRVISRLGLTLGGRYNWESQTSRADSYRSDVNNDLVSLNYAVSGLSQKVSAFTPKVGVDYQITRDIFTYASYTQGDKSGGFNRAAGTLAVASVPVAPEKVRTYEVGLKSSAWDHKITANISIFYNKYDDYQAGVTNPVINGAVVNGNVIVNAGRAHTEGAEFEGSLRPVKGLEWRLTASYLKTRFDEFVNPTGAANADYTGNQLPNAPKFMGSLGFAYKVPEYSLPGSFVLNGSVSYIKSNFIDIANTDSLKTSNQTYVNAGIDYTTPDARWTFSITARNFLNRAYDITSTINPALGVNTTGYNPPRTVLGTIKYQFN